MEPLEIFMEYYNKLVPHIYIPEPAVMEVCSGFVLICHVEGQPILLLFGWGSMCCFHGVCALTIHTHPQSNADIKTSWSFSSIPPVLYIR